MIFRIIFGTSLAILYLLIFTGNVDWFTGFNEAQNEIFNYKTVSVVKAMEGIIFIYLMALSSVFLIVYPHEGYKVFFGFFLAIVTFGVLSAF